MSKTVEIICSPHFLEFLHKKRVSIGLTTYQTNRLFLLGLKADNSLSIFERLFDRPMGLYAEPERLFLATRSHIWQFSNVLDENETEQGYDRVFTPRIGYTTGDLDIHDLSLDLKERPLFVNTLYSCLATTSDRFNFDITWKPPFISDLLPEDRCHLNGLAMENGQPAYVTAVSGSDTVSGWRETKKYGGLLIHVPSGELVCKNLSMPHSPRVYKNRLWLLNAGTGALGFVDPGNGHFTPIVTCPGYLRGLSFHEGFAFVALSMPRYNNEFSGLPLDKILSTSGNKPFCGAMVIDLQSGKIVHWLQFKGGRVTELYDIQILPGVRCPSLVGFMNNQIHNDISFCNNNKVIRHTRVTTEGVQHAGKNISAFVPRSKESPSSEEEVTISLPMNSEEVQKQYEHMTFPSISQRMLVKQLNEPLFCSLSLKNRQPVAMGVVEVDGDKRASVISLVVHPKHRGQGLGKKLLRSLEKQGLEQDITSIHIQYRKNWGSTPQLESILRNCGWQKPTAVSLQCKTDIKHISDAPWVWSSSLRNGFSLFPWSELTIEEREAINMRNDFPAILTPFQEEEKISHETSFGIRLDNKIKGWLITHRTKQDTIQYSSLFVEKGRKQAGCALLLLATAIQEQITMNVPYFIFMINEGNQAGRNLTNRRIRPYLLSAVDVYSSKKDLGG